MPIKIPRDLPAFSALEKENIFVMSQDRAEGQDIRPLEICIVNLMPTKIATETQLLRLLGNSPIQVNITLLVPDNHVARNVSQQHLERFYKAFAQIRNRRFDGMIITGAPVEHLPYDAVDYWDELKAIMEFSATNVYSTLFICWAAQAALHHFYQIPRRTLPRKISGVYCHEVLHPSSRLFRGFDDEFLAPHSRYTEVLAEDVCARPELRILAHAAEAGVGIIEKSDGSQVFVTGHMEYDRDTLDLEYWRDVERGLEPQVPEHYYPADDPQNCPRLTWKAHAHLFFSNWLNYYVYQETPFSLSAIGTIPLHPQRDY